MSKRKKLPNPRPIGKTFKVPCGVVTMYVTLNRDAAGIPRELMIKADEGYQGSLDVLAETASLAMQWGCPLDDILRHWRGHQYEPRGIGHGSSMPDAIARRLAGEVDVEKGGE